MISFLHSGSYTHINIDFTSSMSELGPNTMKISSIVNEKGVTQAFA